MRAELISISTPTERKKIALPGSKKRGRKAKAADVVA